MINKVAQHSPSLEVINKYKNTPQNSRELPPELLTNQLENKNKYSAEISLVLSEESIEKHNQEQQDIGKKIAEEILLEHQKKSSPTDEQNETPIDKLISQITDKIEEIQEKLKTLESESSETASQTRQLLQSQLIALNGILLALIEKKIESIKSSK